MPRTARIKTETHIYHIMMRGINRQCIFKDSTEKNKFLKLLRQTKSELDVEVFAYCIMDNHVHLLLRENQDPIETFCRKINTSYAIYYNAKHERCGHLFQDRYKSEAVKDEKQLLLTVRYIHMNPVKARICSNPEDYEASSYSEYTFGGTDALCDREYILSLFGGIESFMMFHGSDSDFICMDVDNVDSRMSDANAFAIVRELYPGTGIIGFKALDKAERAEVIASLIKKHLSIRQISLSTGLSIDTIRKLSAKLRKEPANSAASKEPSP